MTQSSPRTILAEGALTANDRLVIELVDPAADTPQLVVVHWPVKATALRPAAYGDAAAKGHASAGKRGRGNGSAQNGTPT